MKSLALFFAVSFFAGVLNSGAGDITAVPVVPFPAGSLWYASGEGATLVRGGRINGRILLEGTGTSVNPGTASRVTARQATRFFRRAVQTKLESFTALNPAAEAGIGLEAGVGMRLVVTPGGTLWMEGRTFSPGTVSGGPVTGLSFPLWLRVTYLGGGTKAEYSQNGTAWTQIGGLMPLTFPEGYALLLCTSGSLVQTGCALFADTAISGGDADENGVLDGYEMQNFGRLTGPGTLLDADGDGRSLITEWLQGTNSAVADAPPYFEMQPVGDGRVDLVARNQSRPATVLASTDLRIWAAVRTSAATDTRGTYYRVTPPTASRAFWRPSLPVTDDPLF